MADIITISLPANRFVAEAELFWGLIITLAVPSHTGSRQ